MKRTPQVILLIETSRAFDRGLLHGIARYSRIHGPWVFHRKAGDMEKALKDLEGCPAGGISLCNPAQSQELVKLGISAIHLLDRKPKSRSIPIFLAEAESITQMAARHFLERGFQHFAYSGFTDLRWSMERCRMFRKQMSDAGFSVSIFNQSEVQMNRHLQREKSRLAGWIRSLPKPLALMACNDDHGKHVLDACKLAAVGVPEEVAVLGVDNDELVCELSDPPMTSIALNAEQAGYQAAELLDQWMKGQTVKTQQITVTPTHIVTRQSTDVLAVDDPDVANALRFIRQHSFRTPVQVTDVAEAVATSRRVLERKFQNVLHRSILQEIRRVRVNHIIAMLMETDLPISYIARKTGFSGIEHIARYFRRETGTSLRDYRKKHRP